MADPTPASIHVDGMVGTRKRPIEKPYPSEHASRQNDPEKYKTIRRQNDKFGPGVHVLFGVLPSGKTEVQALRFDKDRFTLAEARTWLKDHDYKTNLEPAVQKADYSDEYVRSFFKIARRLLPSWLFSQLHKLAFHKSGGHARWHSKLIEYEPKTIEKEDDGHPDPKVMIACMVPFEIGLKLTEYQRRTGPGAVHRGDLVTGQNDGICLGSMMDRLHLTLCYLGRLSAVGDEIGRIREILSDLCDKQEPMTAKVHAVGRFGAMESSEGNDVVCALVDCPGLCALRSRIVEALAFIGVPVARDHDFTPHVTLEYVTPLKQVEVPMPDLEFCINSVGIHVGLEGEYFPFIEVDADDWDKGVTEQPRNVQMIEVEKSVAIAKMDKKKQIVYGVVLEPDTIDTQGDVMSAEEIEKAAHRFMEMARRIGLSHTKRADAVPIESFIPDEDIKYGGQLVKRGSWILGVKINDPDVWKDVEAGIYNAFSVGGYGSRASLERAVA